MYDGNVATVRFIGTPEFSDGVWLGLEFGYPVGRNDGSVDNVTYFKTKPRHGLFVRPFRATFHGVSCANVLGITKKHKEENF